MFVSMEPYREGGPFAGLLAAGYRSRRLRAAVFARPQTSVYRRSLILRFFSWCYRVFNHTGQIPEAVFAPEAELRQTAALIDTAGTFEGRAGLARALEELRDAFENIRFEPHSLVELEAGQVLVIVRFRASGRGSGIEVDRRVGHLFTIQDGSAVRWDVYWEEEDALEAAGLG